LRDPAVRSHFNDTLFAFEASGWGPNEAMMSNFGLFYTVVVLGAGAAEARIKAMLQSGQPALFYLWTPHAMFANFKLHRVDLPAFRPELFAAARSDYPTDVLEKVAARRLGQIAPLVQQLYSRFRLDNGAQESMMGAVDDGGLSVKQVTCNWLTAPENALTWRAWLPSEQPQCAAGQHLNESESSGLSSCSTCPAGFVSEGGTVTACTMCERGALANPAIMRAVNRFVKRCSQQSSPGRRIELWRCAGYFQPTAGQLACLSCDILRDSYQEHMGRNACTPCPANTARFVGGPSAANPATCQCKRGPLASCSFWKHFY
jgi:hypothetical protein